MPWAGKGVSLGGGAGGGASSPEWAISIRPLALPDPDHGCD